VAFDRSCQSVLQGPWLDGILERYGMYPEIESFQTFAIVDNPGGTVALAEAI
jgi:hypothetical protein